MRFVFIVFKFFRSLLLAIFSENFKLHDLLFVLQNIKNNKN